MNDEFWMRKALDCAQQAFDQGEVPVGAVLVYQNELLAEAWDQSIAQNDPSAHAEILALRQAGQKLKNYRLLDTTLYVTLEPCAMCAGALINARVKRLVFALADAKTGACGSVFNITDAPCLNHRLAVQQGLLSEDSLQLLQAFFKSRRE